jgi:hypothetical protein
LGTKKLEMPLNTWFTGKCSNSPSQEKKHAELHLIVLVPAQIVRSGRRIIYRIMGYNGWLKELLRYLGISSPDGACLK